MVTFCDSLTKLLKFSLSGPTLSESTVSVSK